MELRWRRLEGRDGHAVARELLAEMISPLPEIRRTEQGKPYFVGSDLHFSISHTPRHAFCVVSQKNVGIDAEEMDRKTAEHLRGILSESERRRVLPGDSGGLLRLWVLKESFAKLTGRGIGNYLKSTDFDPDDPRIQQIDGCYVAVLEE